MFGLINALAAAGLKSCMNLMLFVYVADSWHHIKNLDNFFTRISFKKIIIIIAV